MEEKTAIFWLGNCCASLEVGCSGFDTNFFCFVRSRDDASVVVGEYNDRFVFQVWAEDSFAGYVAVVAVDDGVHKGWLVFSPVFDGPNNDAPDFKVVVGIDADGLEVFVGGSQLYVSVVSVAEVEVFDGEFFVDVCHDDVAVLCFDRAVDDGYVAVVNAGFNHRVAFHFSVECGFGIADEIAIEVDGVVGVVVCWRRESGFDGWCKVKFQTFVESRRV